MYLKALEIQGFKSFADKTRLTFEKDITAIVGPNGSGKSNISDAIMWVMGEQRSRALRGSKMEDVIFGGTQKRGALGYAQVSLIIDNSQRIFDSDSSEIMLTRRYYRSGDSEYFINRENVRLKDINDLLMDTGLGRDGYSIIGQGRIAEIVSSKSTDRREVFEEAAGISRFRYRKEEAQRKLEKTQENLLRINDKIEELEMQVGPLKKQAEVAKRYLVLRDELRVKEVSLWMTSLERLKEQLAAVELEQRQAEAELDQARRELEGLYAASGGLSERMRQKDVETDRARERLSRAEAELSRAEAEAAVLKANMESSRQNQQQLNEEIEKQAGREAELRESIAAGRGRLEEIDRGIKDLEAKQRQNQNVLAGCRMKLEGRERLLHDLQAKADQLTVDIRSTASRIELLDNMQKEHEGYSKAVRTVMRESRRGTLRGIHAPVADLVRSQDRYALAIETALGAAAQNIVVDSREDGRRAIELLKRMDQGRATFLPVDTIRGRILRDMPGKAPGLVGLALDLVSFDEGYREIFTDLLGRTLVAESLGDAVKLSRDNGDRLRIVTLDGQMINPGGSMTGGSAVKGSGFISRANELEKLRSQSRALEAEQAQARTRLEQAGRDVAGVRHDLELAQDDQGRLNAEHSALEAEQRTSQANIRQLEALLEGISGDAAQRRQAMEAARQQIEDFARRLEDMGRSLEERRKAAQAIRQEIQDISQSRLELEGSRAKTERQAQQRSQEIMELERRGARIEQKKLTAQMEEKQLLDKLWDNYELSHSAAEQLREPVEDVHSASKHITELRRQISSLGAPNLGAIDEYERVNGRYEFLAGQRDDVSKAKGELEDIIRDLTGQMEILFMERFKEIDQSFRQTFLELFGGGKAALRLEDEKDVLNCGIEIQVQPPGKALSTISLLSGGEMAFVAIALYFAILKVRPTPFCVMDEIEAALDEANVSRYAQYMRRMAGKTQFLVITHRRGTMEEADMLYGVTMQEKGVSTVIELDLESAQKTIEE